MNPTIELPVAELKTALTGLSKIISKRTTLPVLEHLRVTRDQKGVVTLQATNLDVTAIYSAEQPNAGQPCDFLVPFEPLNKLVKGGKEPVQIVCEGKDQVRLKTFIGTSPMEQQFTALPVNEFPPTPVITGKAVPVDATFRDSFRQALECCSNEGSRHVIQHVCLDTRLPEGHYLAATDGRHLFCANSFKFELVKPVLIPNQPFLHWDKFMEEGVGELSVKPKSRKQDSSFQLKSGRWTYLSKSCDEEFPNWKQVVPAESSHRTRIQFNSQAVETLLAGVPRLPGGNEGNRSVKLEILGGVLIVKARDRDAKEWTRLTVDGVRIVGKAVSTTLNRDYLLKALRFGLTTVEIENELAPLDFSHEGRRMIVMPIKSYEPAPQSAAPSESSPTPPTLNTNPPVNEPTPAQPQETVMPKATEAKSETKPTEQPTVETSPVKAVVQQIENIKETLKGVLRQFSEVTDQLKQLEKEKRTSDREMESVREKLREIQQVRI